MLQEDLNYSLTLQLQLLKFCFNFTSSHFFTDLQFTDLVIFTSQFFKKCATKTRG